MSLKFRISSLSASLITVEKSLFSKIARSISPTCLVFSMAFLTSGGASVIHFRKPNIMIRARVYPGM